MNPAEKTDQILSWVFDFFDTPISTDKKTLELYKKILYLIIEEPKPKTAVTVEWEEEP